MDIIMKKLLSISLILILITAGFYTGCKKNKGEPPVLPPPESMAIDFSNFGALKKSEVLTFGQKGANNTNWEYAAIVVGVWKLIITSTLAVPITSFKLAIDQDPVYLEEKTWQWSYTVNVAGATYKARLKGQILSTDVSWKMYITKEGTGGFAEFLWFEGTSKLDGTGGQWILKESASSSGNLLQIDWTKTDSSIGSVKYTYVKNDTFQNSFILYELTTGTLNAKFTIHYYNGLKFSDVYVEWNTSTHNGRAKSVDYLGDDKWYCWDASKINVECQ
jgi:hypothetical protein